MRATGTRKNDMRESKIEKYLAGQVKIYKGETRKVKFIGHRGAPDRMVWLPWWKNVKMPEMKAPGKPLEPHQQREHKRLKKMGIETTKLDSFEDVDRFLNKGRRSLC